MSTQKAVTLNEHTQSVQSRGRRIRVLAAVLSAGLLLSAAACGSGGDSAGGLPSGDDSAGDSVRSNVSLLKVCELVDLETLATTLTSPGYEFGPEDIPVGSGVDPGGPQCAAQLKLPQLASATGMAEDLIPARLQVAVTPHDDIAAATAGFDERISYAEDGEGSESEELDGPWTRGKIVTAEGGGDELVHGIVQKDTYVVRIELHVSPDEGYQDKFTFTIEDVKAAVVEVLGTLYTAVSAEIEG